jgi:D-alanyl-D-alanine carboxypeptidase
MVTLSLALLFCSPSTVEARFEELFAASKLHGLSACVITKDGTTITLAKGYADPEKTLPLTPAHRFLAGSTGKTFFAALAMQLDKEGTIDLDKKLSEYLGKEDWYSRLPNHDTVTLAHLMRHQSGIPEHLDNPDLVPALLKDADKVWLPKEMVAFSLDKQPLFKPGEGWSYSDTNYILLAMAIEKATAKQAYAMIDERYIKKLSLKDTEPSTKRTFTNFSNGNHNNGALFANGWAIKEGRLVLNPQFEWAGGGYVTNPRDLATWIRALVSQDVLDPATRTKMQQGVPARTGRNHEYAYGLMLRPSEIGKSLGHGGWYPGYITDVQNFPDTGVTVCIMANSDNLADFGINYQLYCVELAKAATSSRSQNQNGPALRHR